jgi:predicted ferric reductase
MGWKVKRASAPKGGKTNQKWVGTERGLTPLLSEWDRLMLENPVQQRFKLFYQFRRPKPPSRSIQAFQSRVCSI